LTPRIAVIFDRHYEEIWSYLSRRPQHARRRLAPRRLAPVGLVGALAALAVGIVLALSLRGGAANPPSAAAVVLARAAHAAEKSAGPRRLRPGEY
jgi:hypothetical protein